jgi:hypothetical protein
VAALPPTWFFLISDQSQTPTHFSASPTIKVGVLPLFLASLSAAPAIKKPAASLKGGGGLEDPWFDDPMRAWGH